MPYISVDHFTDEDFQKAVSENLELGALPQYTVYHYIYRNRLYPTNVLLQVQSNLSNTDTKGTEQSVRIGEVIQYKVIITIQAVQFL